MYLFQPRPGATEAGSSSEPGLPVDADRHLELAGPSIQPGSAAEWAFGELLIRLCNGGKPLRPGSREGAPDG